MKRYGEYAKLGLVLAVAVFLVPTPGLAGETKGTIKIATQSPLSGEQSAPGEGIKLGTQLAIEQLKGPIEKLGFKVEMVPFDDQAKPDVGVSNAKNIITDKDIMAVIGHWNSGVAIPSSEVYKEAMLVEISPANTNPMVTDRNLPNVNRVCGRDDVQGAVGAEFAKSLKIKTAYVIHDKTTYGQSVAEFFRDNSKKLGIDVLGFEGTEEKSNFDPILTPAKAKNPDLIYFGGIYNQAAPLFKQAREKGIKAKFLGPDGLDSPELTKIGGKAVVGLYYTTAAGPVKMYPNAQQFAKAYKTKFGKDPEPYAAESYDSAAIALKAIETAIKAGGGKMPARDAVTAAVRKVKQEGITGHIEFDEKGDRKKAGYFILEVVSEDPAKWADNKLLKRLEIAPPPLKK
ncbi:MAG TPA: branched-chain amino acid ABC transporter substrate-binding protein [Candidatus Methylomirabilis sp.]|nr:branched-chain amino acid ABC transporter substrate-binding protein [Candidatus Methylomirabilis sp.]